MLSTPSPIRSLLLVSARELATSCGHKDERPKSAPLTPPVDLLVREDRPVLTSEALVSEDAYEDWLSDIDDWGKANAGIIDRACRWFRDAEVNLICREAGSPPEAAPPAASGE